MIRNTIENIKISHAVILVAILPLLVVLFLASQKVIDSVEVTKKMDALQQLAELSVKMSNLVHEQQKERGATAVFLASDGREFKNKLIAQRKETDRKKEEFFQYIKSFDQNVYGIQFKDKFNYVLSNLERMPDIRAQIDSQTISLSDSIRYFTDLNTESLNIIGSMAQLSTESEVSNHIHSYVNFMQSKERAGIERAVGSAAFSKGTFSPEILRRFQNLISEQDTYLTVFLGMATDAQQSYYWQRIRGKAVDEVVRMRQIAIRTPKDTSVTDASYWYNIMTQKIDMLKDVEDMISGDLRQKAADIRAKSLSQQNQNIFLTSFIVILTTLLCAIIVHTINDSFRNLFVAVKKIAEGDTKTLLPEQTNNEIGEMVAAAKIFKERLAENIMLTQQLSEHKDELEQEVIERTKELKASDARSKAIIDNSVDGIITIDPKGIVQSFSPSAERMFGYNANEVIGENIKMLMPEPHRSGHDGYLQHYRNTGEKHIIGARRDLEAQHKDGTVFPIKLGVGEINLDNETMFVGTVSDISKEKAVLEEIKQKSKEAQEAQVKAEEANRTKSEFLANMSHELRTPLNSLLILARELMDNDEENLTAEQVEDASIIYESGNDLLTLINDILDLAKIESGKMDALVEDVSITDIARNVQMKFNHMAKDKGLILNVNIDPLVPEIIQSDKLRIEQILRNFLSNAFKFTQKGAVTVDIEMPDDSVKFYDNTLQAEDMIVFAVTDTGIGIHPAKQEAVFEAFQQADGSTTRKYGGTGLGLSIARELAGLLGGEIHLKSAEGEGSTFTLYINRALKIQTQRRSIFHTHVSTSKKEQVALIREEDLKGAPANNLADDRDIIGEEDTTILVVDDDQRFAKIVRNKIRSKGYKALVGTDGLLGLQLIANYNPDAIILDIDLPEVNGIDIYERVRNNPDTADLPIYFMSVHDDAPILSDDNAVGFLSKPVSAEQLEQAFVEIESVAATPVKHLLIVEDDEMLRHSVSQVVKKRDINITEAGNGLEALEVLKTDTPDCILLDLMMPKMDGITFLKKVAEDESLSLPRVIVYSAKDLTREETKIIESYTDLFIHKNGSNLDNVMDKAFAVLRKENQKTTEKETDSSPKDKEKTPAVSVASDTNKSTDNKSTDNTPYDLSGKKILITDDEPRNIFALSRMLKSTGVEIHTANNGQEALDMLEKTPNIECVLMDMMMPIMNGYEAMEKIREQEKWLALPVVAVTAKAMQEDQDKCMESGATAYIPKPVDKDTLLSTLSEFLITKAS